MRRMSGPMVVITALIAIGWFVLGVLSFVGLQPPAGTVLGVGGIIGGLATAWLALSMRIIHDDEGIILPRRGRVSWDRIHSVEVQPGIVSVPYVVVSEGRALTDIPLDGLAWFGGPQGLAGDFAEKLAAAAGLPGSTQRPVRGGRGRRAL